MFEHCSNTVLTAPSVAACVNGVRLGALFGPSIVKLQRGFRQPLVFKQCSEAEDIMNFGTGLGHNTTSYLVKGEGYMAVTCRMYIRVAGLEESHSAHSTQVRSTERRAPPLCTAYINICPI